ncbi:bifunctional folylpolyglutamate synthase/dihydrofolate synthase [Brevibacillus ginsengisoli]|uniref:bifunctional folylpolyglutamate synthase/dihydrofolate synthase n=1 Tax=Brevibacillus ginsengisoli TaxID=363854 RepID=UPI003CF8DD84
MKAEDFHSYEEAIDWLHSFHKFGQKPGLERVEWLLQELGNPERRLAFIHVAGTNGKGSTCAYLTHMLMEAGYSVGTFTSPYLVDFRERICHNKEMIAPDHLLRLVNQLKQLVQRCADTTEFGSPTEFEVITVLAILYFAEVVRPSVVVWETGLGGRLDSTNVVHPLVSVITNVGLDHTDILGDTHEQIAYEKAGIIKSGVPVVIGKLTDEALKVVKEIADQKNANLYQAGHEFDVYASQESVQLGEQHFSYQSVFHRDSQSFTIRMNGEHQLQNAAVALMVTDLLREYYAYHLTDEDISRGLESTTWSGRLEMIQINPAILLDGAHNAEGMQALTASIAKLVPKPKKIHVLIAALVDKPLSKMASEWAKIPVQQYYLTTFDFPRAASIEYLQDAWLTGESGSDRITVIPDWRSFLREWSNHLQEHEDDLLIVCGSLYFIAQVRALFSVSS